MWFLADFMDFQSQVPWLCGTLAPIPIELGCHQEPGQLHQDLQGISSSVLANLAPVCQYQVSACISASELYVLRSSEGFVTRDSAGRLVISHQ